VVAAGSKPHKGLAIAVGRHASWAQVTAGLLCNPPEIQLAPRSANQPNAKVSNWRVLDMKYHVEQLPGRRDQRTDGVANGRSGPVLVSQDHDDPAASTVQFELA